MCFLPLGNSQYCLNSGFNYPFGCVVTVFIAIVCVSPETNSHALSGH